MKNQVNVKPITQEKLEALKNFLSENKIHIQPNLSIFEEVIEQEQVKDAEIVTE